MEPQEKHASKRPLEGTLIREEHPELFSLSFLLKVQNPRNSQTRRFPEGQELLGGFGS